MALEVRYARRPDGVRTAYTMMGHGPVLIVPPGGTTSIEWYSSDTTAHEQFCERLAKHRTVVLYDRHGTGLSDRNRTDFTFEDDLKDLDAVIEAVGASKVDFFGISWGGAPTLAYAANHPDRVSRLVLYGTGSMGRVTWGDEVQAQIDSLASLRRSNWELYHRTRALQFFPSGTNSETLESLGRMLRDSATPEIVEKLATVVAETQSLLSQIAAPALVLHRRGDEVALFSWGQYLARRLPGSRFIALDGDIHFPWAGDADSVLGPTIDFLTEDDEQPASPDALETSSVQTIMFTDLESSTALTQRVGDEAAQEVLHGHNDAVRKALEDNGGREVKHTGDGIMAAFPSAVRAVEAALQIQRDLAGGEVRVRIGLNAGEPIAEDGDFFGTAVQLAARVCDRAEPGQVLVSRVVADLCAGKKLTFTHHSDATLKGFDEPVALFEVSS